MNAALGLLLVPVCAGHNVSKIADTKWARKVLVERLIEEYGREWVDWAFNEILSKTKVRDAYKDMEVDAILAYPSPPKAVRYEEDILENC